jgi:hypothetical protein
VLRYPEAPRHIPLRYKVGREFSYRSASYIAQLHRACESMRLTCDEICYSFPLLYFSCSLMTSLKIGINYKYLCDKARSDPAAELLGKRQRRSSAAWVTGTEMCIQRASRYLRHFDSIMHAKKEETPAHF